ncbi:ribosome biogenesis factor YjgA [Corallincola platygyrae]|uniref:Dual-action ribosomal maturation protein DarP n=1 Tax=Corallincola platygyrae TaxID=1193278 RepID=A0ABW4XQY9_9GAMM
MSHNDDHNQSETEWVSKTQLKREVEALQKLGEQLTKLKPSELAKMPLGDSLREAVELAIRIRSKREGYRRQLQLIGKLMRHADGEAIKNALDGVNSHHQQANVHFHHLEKWRDKLLAGDDDTINAWLSEHPTGDRQKLRQLVRQSKKEQQQNKPPKAARELFRYLRETVGEDEQ